MKDSKSFFSSYSATEMRENLRKKLFLIIPVGNIENHGPHLPLAADAEIAEELALRLAAALAKKLRSAKFLISPTVAIGNVTAFGEKTGLSSGQALLGYLQEICRGAVRIGVKKILIVNGCGGNHAIMTELRKGNRKVAYLPRWWRIPELWKIDDSFKKFIKEGGTADDWAGTHGSELETSAMLAIEKKHRTILVKKDKISQAKGPCSKSAITAARERGELSKIAPAGVFGDASRASAKKGEELFNLSVRHYVEKLTLIIKKVKK